MISTSSMGSPNPYFLRPFMDFNAHATQKSSRRSAIASIAGITAAGASPVFRDAINLDEAVFNSGSPEGWFIDEGTTTLDRHRRETAALGAPAREPLQQLQPCRGGAEPATNAAAHGTDRVESAARRRRFAFPTSALRRRVPSGTGGDRRWENVATRDIAGALRG